MSYRAIKTQFMLFTCIGYLTSSIYLAGQTGNHSYTLKGDLVANNKTEERLTIQNSTGACQTAKIVQPRFDVYVGYEMITLRIKIFQTPLDDTLIILMDNVTIDVTRYENKSCYNIDGKCRKRICSCYLTNNTFISTYRMIIGSHMNCSAVGIEYRFYGIDGSIIKVISFKTFERAYFNHLYTHYSTIKCLEEDKPKEKFAYISSFSYSIFFICIGIMPLAYLIFRCCVVKYKENIPSTICCTTSIYELLQVRDLSNSSTNQHTKQEVNYLDKGYSSSLLISSKPEKGGTYRGSVLKADKHTGANICYFRLTDAAVKHFESPIYRNKTISCDKEHVTQDDSNQIWLDKKVLQL